SVCAFWKRSLSDSCFCAAPRVKQVNTNRSTGIKKYAFFAVIFIFAAPSIPNCLVIQLFYFWRYLIEVRFHETRGTVLKLLYGLGFKCVVATKIELMSLRHSDIEMGSRHETWRCLSGNHVCQLIGSFRIVAFVYQVNPMIQ